MPRPQNGGEGSARLLVVVSMLVFGSIGIFRRYIALPSVVIACVGGLVGGAFLLGFMRLLGRRASGRAVRKNLVKLLAAGAMMGFNWMLLFEAYRFTSVSVATLSYYMAPVFLIVLSAVLLKEKLSTRKMLCVLAAVIGMALASGVMGEAAPQGEALRGVGLALLAAALYAGVLLINRTLEGIGPIEQTTVQLGAAGLVLAPYMLLTENMAALRWTLSTVLLTMVVAVFHTGITYVLFFGSIGRLNAQTVALLTYIDPVTAMVLAALIFGEKLSPPGILGAAMVLGAAVVSEWRGREGQ